MSGVVVILLTFAAFWWQDRMADQADLRATSGGEGIRFSAVLLGFPCLLGTILSLVGLPGLASGRRRR